MMNTIPRLEYPRPQFVRERWMNLNGPWQFEIDYGESGLDRRFWERDDFKDTITVPFCPESDISGIGHKDFIRACWYRREFTLPEDWKGMEIILHFGAVNYDARIWLNGTLVKRHKGGYSSFSVPVGRCVKDDVNVITLLACSDVRAGVQPSGKQCDHFFSAGCSYTRTTGIWQTVWLEAVPRTYMSDIRWTADADNGLFRLDAEFSAYARGTLTVDASYEGKPAGSKRFIVNGMNFTGFIPAEGKHLWAPGEPNLYDFTVTLETEAGIDEVKSYAGLRTVGCENGSVTINGKPFFMRLVLDQGFYPDGVITAPDDSELKSDILRSMAMGFNGARLHQKMFEARFMYWADKLGYVVWGEHGNWGMDVSDGKNIPAFLNEWMELIRRDASSPAVIGWCPFNETQKNTDTRGLQAVYRATKAFDPGRLCIDTSGWVHGEQTDLFDYHDYDQDPDTLRAHLKSYTSGKAGEPFPKCGMGWMKDWPSFETVNAGQPVFLSEYGGIGWIMGDLPANRWGYGNMPETEEEFLTRLEGLTRVCVETEGLCGFCYTQLTDVEQEINGLYTFGRVPKFDADRIKGIFSLPAWNEK